MYNHSMAMLPGVEDINVKVVLIAGKHCNSNHDTKATYLL